MEIGLGCAVSKEDGAGIEDVNSGTGELNEPLIPSSLSWQISKSIQKRKHQRAHGREEGRKCLQYLGGTRRVDRGERDIAIRDNVSKAPFLSQGGPVLGMRVRASIGIWL